MGQLAVERVEEPGWKNESSQLMDCLKNNTEVRILQVLELIIRLSIYTLTTS
jgi:hypothetical protein